MRRLPRWSLFTTFVLVLLVGFSSSLAVSYVRRAYPQLDGELSITGLSAPVEVVRDAHGVPNIYADDAEDLFLAEGYVHAQDRFYEMDVRRHITSGRLSELFGESQVSTDAYIRTMGWRETAQAELPLLSPSTRRYLDAYAAGVNAYLHEHPPSEISLEYSVLGLTGLRYTPEDWTAVDSLSWLKAMAWDLDGNDSEETDRALITAKLGRTRADELYPSSLSGFSPIVSGGSVSGESFDSGAAAGHGRPVPIGTGTGTDASDATDDNSGLSRSVLTEASGVLEAAAKAHTAIPALLGRGGPDQGIGSNSWVVSGSRTSTGKPLLGNDPHLAASIPSIFTQVGLHCRRLSNACPFDVSGFAFSGMPGVIIGHNNAISWGFTASYPDVQDLYLEQVRGNAVRVGDRYQPLQVTTQQIKVKGEDQPRTITVRRSRHGPLLSDVDPQLSSVGSAAKPGAGPDGYAVALKWQALSPGRSMDAVFALNAAQDFGQFRSAASLLASPSQNMVYADQRGNIGYQLPGQLPIRQRGSGDQPAPGWDTRYDWKGTIPFAKLPYLSNPKSGYIVTANQRVIGKQYPYKLGSDYSYGWRSQQLIDRIKAEKSLTPDAAERLFYDETMRYAGRIVPTLLKVKVSDPWVREGQQTMVGWDYTAAADSAAAAYFGVVIHDLLKTAFDDQLPAAARADGGDRWYAVLATLINKPNSPWWDDVRTPQVEDRDDALVAAMTLARKEITSLMARDPGQWQWGKLHRVTLRNQTLGTSGVAPVEKLFNRGSLPIGGGSAVVKAMGYDERNGYQVTSGPTMRMMIDWSDLDHSRWINQSGVSGHAYHENYDDQLPLWASDRLLPMSYTGAAVNQAADHRLRLTPSG